MILKCTIIKLAKANGDNRYFVDKKIKKRKFNSKKYRKNTSNLEILEIIQPIKIHISKF